MKPVVIIGEQNTLKDALDALINKTSDLDTKFAVPAQDSLKPPTFESSLTEPQRLNRKQRRAMAKRSRRRNRRK